MTRSFTLLSAVTVGLALVTACGETQQERRLDQEIPPAAETPQASPQLAMPGQGDQLQTRLVSHVTSARATDATEFRQTFPEHERLVNEMLEDCRQMMRQMGMTPPREFTEMEQALESDLERIPDLSDAELQSLLPEHLDRVQAVIDMRQEMMDKG